MLSNSLESRIFEWTDWDDVGPTCQQFYNVILKIPVGPFPIGHKFDCAILFEEDSILCFTNNDGTEYKFSLILSVAEQLQ